MQNPRSSRYAMPLPAKALSVRRAVETDLPGLVALENETFRGDRLSARQWARHLDSDTARVLIASAGRGLIGAIVLFMRRGSDVARLYSLAIAADSRGAGIGNTLLEAGELTARQCGCARLRLEVRRDNGPAQRLYERRGYRLIGERARYYEDGEDALRFEKTLGQD
ncbi:MAG TPA: GNAT family N-acetyltransferase [Dokdonella sp.]|nr:GNAT family N-acetyltransferase [Dokdonella sp.]